MNTRKWFNVNHDPTNPVWILNCLQLEDVIAKLSNSGFIIDPSLEFPSGQAVIFALTFNPLGKNNS